MTPIRSLLLTTACLTLLVPSLGRACINDTDTVEFELKNMNLLEEIKQTQNTRERGRLIGELVIRAAAGRFERYPKKYYELRIAALKKEPKLDPYAADDLAVAYDRIGDSKSAMHVMSASLAERTPGSEEMYRFHANYGTFLAHDWFKSGAKKSEVKQLDEAAKQIELGLKIRPDAHFGREKIQLQLLRFVAARSRGVEESPLFHFLRKELKDHEIAIGLCGLVMMGAAYESPDVFAALAETRQISQAGKTVARYRSADLVRTRKPFSDTLDAELIKLIQDKDFLKGTTESSKLYLKIRKDGEAVHQQRTSYMLTRLNRGEHPDWEERFWSDWKEPQYPVIHRTNYNEQMMFQQSLVALGTASLMLLAIGFYVRERIITKRKAELPIN
jgi:tetratricopeptide (TPR) repeat protein